MTSELIVQHHDFPRIGFTTRENHIIHLMYVRFFAGYLIHTPVALNTDTP